MALNVGDPVSFTRGNGEVLVGAVDELTGEVVGNVQAWMLWQFRDGMPIARRVRATLPAGFEIRALVPLTMDAAAMKAAVETLREGRAVWQQ